MWIGTRLLAMALLLWPLGTRADESDPLQVPKGGARQQAVMAYNDGVKLMVDRQYAAAQRKFEEALGADEGLAEAHNNLAFSLRGFCAEYLSNRTKLPQSPGFRVIQEFLGQS